VAKTGAEGVGHVEEQLMSDLAKLEQALLDDGYMRCVLDGKLQIAEGDVIDLVEPLRESTTTGMWIVTDTTFNIRMGLIARWLVVKTEKMATKIGERFVVHLIPDITDASPLLIYAIFMDVLDDNRSVPTDVYYVRVKDHVKWNRFKGR